MSTDQLRMTHATHEDLKPSTKEDDVLETKVTFHISDGTTEVVEFSFGPGMVALGYERCAQRLADLISGYMHRFNNRSQIVNSVTIPNLEPSKTESGALEATVTFHLSDGTSVKKAFVAVPEMASKGFDCCMSAMRDWAEMHKSYFNETGIWMGVQQA